MHRFNKLKKKKLNQHFINTRDTRNKTCDQATVSILTFWCVGLILGFVVPFPFLLVTWFLVWG